MTEAITHIPLVTDWREMGRSAAIRLALLAVPLERRRPVVLRLDESWLQFVEQSTWPSTQLAMLVLFLPRSIGTVFFLFSQFYSYSTLCFMFELRDGMGIDAQSQPTYFTTAESSDAFST